MDFTTVAAADEFTTPDGLRRFEAMLLRIVANQIVILDFIGFAHIASLMAQTNLRERSPEDKARDRVQRV